ncbi:MATE family efflux transporter [candidate division WOR-3 bacterium]|nr:MATE family efflux transporter [candidate division WOR-3 bacterium]
MGTQPVGKLLWRFSLPGVIAMVVNATYGIVDTIFVGGLGHNAIAALTMVLPVQMLLTALGSGTGVGAASFIARRLGEKKPDEANAAVGQAMVLAVILGITTAVLGNIFGYPLFRLLGASKAIIADSVSYLSIIVLGTFFTFINMTSANVIRSEGRPLFPMIIMITAAVINVALDPVFIYVLKMGVPGAAVATLIGQSFATIVFLGYLFSRRTSYKLKLSHFKPRLRIWAEIYKIGGPQMLMLALGSVVNAVTLSVISGLGEIIVATYGVFWRIHQFGMMPCIGISLGALPIIGYNFGAGKYSRVGSTLKRTVLISTAITTIVSIIVIVFPYQVAGLFNMSSGSTGFIDYAAPALRIALFAYALLGPQIALSTYFQGTGQGLPTLVIGVLYQALILPAILGFLYLFGSDKFWYSAPAVYLVTFALTVIWAFANMKKLGISLFKKVKDAEDQGLFEAEPQPEIVKAKETTRRIG